MLSICNDSLQCCKPNRDWQKNDKKVPNGYFASYVWWNPFQGWYEDFEHLNNEFNSKSELAGRRWRWRLSGRQICLCLRKRGGRGGVEWEDKICKCISFSNDYIADVRGYHVERGKQCSMQNLWKQGCKGCSPKHTQRSSKALHDGDPYNLGAGS